MRKSTCIVLLAAAVPVLFLLLFPPSVVRLELGPRPWFELERREAHIRAWARDRGWYDQQHAEACVSPGDWQSAPSGCEWDRPHRIRVSINMPKLFAELAVVGVLAGVALFILNRKR